MLVLMLAHATAAFLPTTASSRVSTRPISRPTVLRMGGFGGQVKSKAPKKKGKGKKRGPPPPKPAATAAKDREPAAQPAVTAEQAQAAHMDAVRQAVERHAPSIASGLEQHGYAVVDDFMTGEAVATMRAEATALLSGDHMAPSQSTRYDEARGEVVAYEKHNVTSTNPPTRRARCSLHRTGLQPPPHRAAGLHHTGLQASQHTRLHRRCSRLTCTAAS